MQSIIAKLKADGVLKLWRAYRAGHFQDLGDSNHGTPISVVLGYRGASFPLITSLETVADSSNLRLTTGTVIVFGNFNSQTATETLVSKKDAGGTMYDLYLNATQLVFSDGTNNRTITTSLNNKRCIGVTFATGGTPIGYVDGLSIGNFSGAVTIAADDAPLILGNIYSGSQNSQNTIADVLLCSRVLTASEMAAVCAELNNTTWPTMPFSRFNRDKDNQFYDYDMEGSGISGFWEAGNNATVTKETTTPHSGSQCLRIARADTNAAYAKNSISSGRYPVGEYVKVWGWFRGDGTNYAYVNFNGVTVATSTTANTWQYFEFVGTAKLASSSNPIRFLCSATVSGGYAEFDDVGLMTFSKKDFKTDWGVKASAESGGTVGQYLDQTPFQFGDATARYKVSTDTIQGKLVKVIECTTAGLLSLPTSIFGESSTSEAAYGTWEGWAYKGSDAGTMNIAFICDSPTSIAGSGYKLAFTATETVQIARLTGTVHLETAAAYITINTWYKWKITRTALGVTYLWLNDVLVSVTGGSGTNPYTSTAYTSSTHVVLDFDAGDKLAIADVGGNYSFRKYLNVI